MYNNNKYYYNTMDIKAVNFSGIKYVQADKILQLAPIYSKGIKNTRSLVRNKNITDDMYLFAKINENGKWKRSDGKSAKFDKVFIRKDFLGNIPELNREDNEVIVDENGVQEAPEIIDLDNEEKFKDDEGNIIEIETRGERHHDKIYFKVKDVSEQFEVNNLYTTLIDVRKKYCEEKDYKYFTLKYWPMAKKRKVKNPQKKNYF